MKPYPKYTTTVIGAYSVPDWYEPLDRLMSVGQLSMTAMADAQYRASEAAIHDQERAGIDVITGGEMHRRTHNRHSPPNAMLNYFWQKIPAFQGRLAEAALKLRPNHKVLYTTGYTRNAVVHNGVLDPDVNFIAKPFTFDQLGQKIRDVLS